ncbi:MAG: efflux RND transporter periplasmic adaptor subunit [Sphingomonadales bacterium]|nr:MAG: efflux RND transporter periplasmic adaptor subunit [Sphingomonadales bacterium]TNF04616.1 MAG: efflux RND transporter periplasmic adaptor subunit [Sphingomonadales bacterium]
MKMRGLMIAAALTVSACGGGEQKSGQAAGTLPAGEQLSLRRAPVADLKAVAGEIATRDQAEALARIPGTLVSLSVKEGDWVKQGQRIGMVVDQRINYETSAYGAQAAAAEAEAARARADLARVQDLYNNKVYAKARLDQAVAASRVADAQAAAARAQRGASASVAGQGAILAPATGRVLRADVPAGSVVAPGMSVATVTAGAPVIRLELPESLAGQVRVGARVVLTGDELPAGSRQGRVAQVYPAVSGGRIRVDATVPGLSTDVVGRRVAASIEVGQREALVVPRKFVTTRYGIDYVDVVGKDKRLSSVPVQTAPTAEADKVEMLSGVAAGDTLFVAGAGK